MNYYDQIAEGYDRLHKEEQLEKLEAIRQYMDIRFTDSLLDVGCGTGFSLDYFTVSQAVGVDPSKGLLEQYAGKHSVYQQSAEQLSFKENTFDVVISVTALQNFDDVSQGIKEICRVGKQRFALSILKRSPRLPEARAEIKAQFASHSIREYELDKDILFIIK